jgi:hypothetical protein
MVSDVEAEEDSLEHWTTERFLDFLDHEEIAARPFFAWLSYDRSHYPTTLPRAWFEQVDAARSQWPDNSRLQVCEDWYTRCIVLNGWKLVFDSDPKGCQLYDLKEAPWCFVNRWLRDMG